MKFGVVLGDHSQAVRLVTVQFINEFLNVFQILQYFLIRRLCVVGKRRRGCDLICLENIYFRIINCIAAVLIQTSVENRPLFLAARYVFQLPERTDHIRIVIVRIYEICVFRFFLVNVIGHLVIRFKEIFVEDHSDTDLELEVDNEVCLNFQYQF